MISVIVPTYKPGSYLWECLESLASQDIGKDTFEVILILNGIINPYSERIRQYLCSHNIQNVRLIETEIAGVSNARNIGLDNCVGDFITFLDDDDYVSPTYLSSLMKDATVDTISLCNPQPYYEDGITTYFPITAEYNKCKNLGKIPFYKAKRFFSGPVYKLMHKDIIADRRFDINFHHSEDALFMFVISDKFKYVKCSDASAIYYRRFRSGSAVTTKRSFLEKMSNAIKIIICETIVFICHLGQYNFYFYITRILGAFHGALVD